jgi:phospholipid/cholesterol/gamma-HCH transport system substrate-binding protein
MSRAPFTQALGAVRRRLVIVVAVLIVAGLAAAGGAVASSGGGGTQHLTAYFTRTIGLYQGNDVRILGVRVGSIDKMTVVGTKVRVEMSLDGKYKLPADVQAVIIPPSVVSDRYIQLTPAYTGGPTLPDNSVLDTDRTQVPLEFDEIFRNLDQLNRALGPQGANKNGALSRLINVSAKNLAGNGDVLNGALKQFSAAISTLAGSRGDLFATVRQLQQFTSTLAANDGGIRALNSNMQKVGGQLAGERRDLGAALSNLATALTLVNSFVANNRTALTGDIHGLTKVTSVLSREKEALTEIVDMAPFALSNLALAGDPKAHTLDTKDDPSGPLTNPVGPNGIICQVLGGSFCTASAAPASWEDLLKVRP